MFDTMFEGHFASVTDTVTVTDPWGIGFSIEVLREDHPDWTAWKKANGIKEQTDILQEITAASAKTMLKQQFAGKLAATEVSTEQAQLIVDNAFDSLPAETILAALQGTQSGDLNEMKPGIASVLLKSWTNVRAADGAPVPLDLHNALKFLGWEGVLIEADKKLPAFLKLEDYKVNGEDHYATTFTGSPRRADGSLWAVPADTKPYSGLPVGDAIARMILDGAKQGTIARASVLRQSADFLADTPDGSPATSGDAASTSSNT